VSEAKQIPAGTPALKERHRRYFWGILPAFLFPPGVLKTIRHKRKKALKPAGTARRHMKFPVLLLPSSIKKKIIFLQDTSYSGLNS
jgi:hypothetical protein